MNNKEKDEEKTRGTNVISEKEYKRTPLREWMKLKVRTGREMRNDWGIIPLGTLARITEKRKGFTIETDPCPLCGLQAVMSRIKPHELGIMAGGESNELRTQATYFGPGSSFNQIRNRCAGHSEIVILTASGPSGCGKTNFLRQIAAKYNNAVDGAEDQACRI